MAAPVTLLYHRKFFKQFACCPSFDSSHNLTRGHRWWCRYKYVHMILAYNPTDYPYLKSLAGLPNQLFDPLSNIAGQYMIAILCYPYKMVLNIENRVAS